MACDGFVGSICGALFLVIDALGLSAILARNSRQMFGETRSNWFFFREWLMVIWLVNKSSKSNRGAVLVRKFLENWVVLTNRP